MILLCEWSHSTWCPIVRSRNLWMTCGLVRVLSRIHRSNWFLRNLFSILGQRITDHIPNKNLSQQNKRCMWGMCWKKWLIEVVMATSSVHRYSSINGWQSGIGVLKKFQRMTGEGSTRLERHTKFSLRIISPYSTLKCRSCTAPTHKFGFLTIISFPKISVLFCR